ncbi:MAG TPA: hypothetical protein VH684_26310 [Xanthobacteraceae bacterium]|jgi:hypothetical protein
MRSVSCRAAILFVLAIVGPAAAGEAAQQFIANFAAPPTLSDTETTGSISAPSLPLSDEQRGLVFLGVINLPDRADADLPDSMLTSALPETIELYDLPAMVVRKVPLLQGYKFVKLADRILLVRPTDRIVVSDIPRYRLVR